MMAALRRLAEFGVTGRIILAGSAAAILGKWVSRPTEDVDVIASEPKLSQIANVIQQVAEELGLPQDWLNDAAIAWRDYLQPDFLDRAARIERFHDLEIWRVSREDFVLLKLIGLRPQDLDDLRELQPTPEELTYARDQLNRISELDGGAALRVELYLKQAGIDENDE